MMRILSLCFLVWLGLPAAAQTAQEQKPSADQKIPAQPKTAVESKTLVESKAGALLCVYDSKNYSEGATVCVQKAMMQTCMLDGTKAIWVPLTDAKLSSRCTKPAPRLSKYQRRAIWNRRNIAREITPATNTSPFCFYTNGKRYCE